MSYGGLSGPSARQSVEKSPEKDEKNLRNKCQVLRDPGLQL